MGSNILTATETDAAGVTATTTLTYSYEPNPPPVTLTSAAGAASGTITKNPELVGNTLPGATVSIFDGVPNYENTYSTLVATLVADNSGNFSFTAPDVDSNTDYYAEVTSAAGLTTNSSVYDLALFPTVDPGNDLTVSASADNGSIEYDVGAPQPISPDSYTSLTLTFTDSAGNTLVEPLSIINGYGDIQYEDNIYYFGQGLLDPGIIQVSLTATDAAGNTATI